MVLIALPVNLFVLCAVQRLLVLPVRMDILSSVVTVRLVRSPLQFQSAINVPQPVLAQVVRLPTILMVMRALSAQLPWQIVPNVRPPVYAQNAILVSKSNQIRLDVLPAPQTV